MARDVPLPLPEGLLYQLLYWCNWYFSSGAWRSAPYEEVHMVAAAIEQRLNEIDPDWEDWKQPIAVVAMHDPGLRKQFALLFGVASSGGWEIAPLVGVN